MENILIYLRAEQHKTLQKRKVCVRDIGGIYCEDTKVVAQIGGLVINNIIGKKAVIQMIDIIERITKEFPNAQIINFGAPDILVEYEIPRKNKFPERVKVFSCLRIDLLWVCIYDHGIQQRYFHNRSF